MIRSQNPRIDVAALEARITEELARDPQGSERLARLAAAVHLRSIENALARAEERSEPRTEWPAELSRIPVPTPGLRRLVLRLMGLVFRDQFDVNAQLIRSQRETLALVSGLLERVESLEAQLDAERKLARAQRLAERDDGV